MSNKKLQVFVSSTFEDLKEERQAAVEAILSAGHIPAGMELFTAGDETQMAVIKRWIDESDVYLLILGGRYGSAEKVSGKSYTQLEYEYTVKKAKALFAVVITETALEAKLKAQGSRMIEQDNPKELRIFREEVKTKLVKFWDDKKDIKLAIHETLNDFNYRKELIGWIRGDNAITGVVAEELARLGKENAELKRRVSNLDSTILYAGLDYYTLKEMLEEDSFSGDISPFEYLKKFGDIFISGAKYPGTDNTSKSDEMIFYFEKLLLFKIIVKRYEASPFNLSGSRDWTRCYFTDDGHNFYLKALALQNQENKSQSIILSKI